MEGGLRALSLKNTLSNRCAIQELNGRHVISFGKSKTISSWRRKLVSDAVFKQIPGGGLHPAHHTRRVDLGHAAKITDRLVIIQLSASVGISAQKSHE